MLVIVHGGAAAVSPALLEQKLFDLRQAAKAGFLVLLQERGKDDSSQALDAVQASVQLMEDSPYFNAGFGSSLTSSGEVEMDAIIADGKRLDFGAISSVTSFKNPVQVARSVLDCSEHCLFTAEGAQQFGQQQGIPLIERSQLVHKYAKDRLEEFKTFNNAILCDHDEEKSSGDHDTVGAVAIDQFGNLAAGTSTGGITGKQPGRVGDTPVIGSGAYADNLVGAVSTTGHGEAIMRVCLAREVLYRYQQNLAQNGDNAMQAAVEQSLELMRKRVDGFGGVIAVGARQEIGIAFNTKGMPWAYISSADLDGETLAQLKADNSYKIQIHYGYNPGDHGLVALQ